MTAYQLQCLVDLVEQRARSLFPARFATPAAQQTPAEHAAREHAAVRKLGQATQAAREHAADLLATVPSAPILPLAKESTHESH